MNIEPLARLTPAQLAARLADGTLARLVIGTGLEGVVQARVGEAGQRRQATRRSEPWAQSAVASDEITGHAQQVIQLRSAGHHPGLNPKEKHQILAGVR